MVDFWQNKNVIVTGGNGFLGKHLVSELNSKGCKLFVPSSKHFDLRQTAYIDALLKNSKVDILFHLAGNVGGIGYNLQNPYNLFYDNAIMGIKLIDAALRYGVKKFVQIGTVCSYPADTPVLFREEDLWNGHPEPTNAPYGIAKKILLTQLQSAWMQFAYSGIYLIPTNLYGPGDEFSDHKSHVIPALIKKFLDAKKYGSDCVNIWGNEGKVSRDFLYVSDAAKGIVKAAEVIDRRFKPIPINLGTGIEIDISLLANTIRSIIKYEGEINWVKEMPEGQEKRALDISLAFDIFGWEAETSLEQGLKETIKWYQEERANANNDG